VLLVVLEWDNVEIAEDVISDEGLSLDVLDTVDVEDPVTRGLEDEVGDKDPLSITAPAPGPEKLVQSAPFTHKPEHLLVNKPVAFP